MWWPRAWDEVFGVRGSGREAWKPKVLTWAGASFLCPGPSALGMRVPRAGAAGFGQLGEVRLRPFRSFRKRPKKIRDFGKSVFGSPDARPQGRVSVGYVVLDTEEPLRGSVIINRGKVDLEV